MRQYLKSAFAAAIAALIAQAAAAETKYQPWQQDGVAKRPYIFTQQHNVLNKTDGEAGGQLIRLGYPLQVQLPGNPALWTFQPDASLNVEYLGRTMVYSPNRIEGTESIQVFDLALTPDAASGTQGYFTFTTAELPPSLDRVVPGGIYVVHFAVIEPSK